MGRAAPPRADCRICAGSGEDAHDQRCVCTYNRDRALAHARSKAGESNDLLSAAKALLNARAAHNSDPTQANADKASSAAGALAAAVHRAEAQS